MFDQKGRENFKRLTGAQRNDREVEKCLRKNDGSLIDIVDPILTGCGLRRFVETNEEKMEVFGLQMDMDEDSLVTQTSWGWILADEGEYCTLKH